MLLALTVIALDILPVQIEIWFLLNLAKLLRAQQM